MTSPLESENIITNISTYLPPNDLFLFSAINKSTYDSKLNPINNPLINSLYRSHVISKIYLGEFSNEDDIKNEKEILDDYNITKNNWKRIYIELMQNFSNFHYEDKQKYKKDVYKRFRDHIYLPFIRKENVILENKDSSLHQYYCYDFHKNSVTITNHFDKFLDLNNNGFFYQDKDKFILRKNMYFENELLCFNELLINIKGNNDYIMILEKIINYDYNGIEEFYCRNNKREINNVVLDFVLWLNHSVILFSKLLYSKIKIYCYNTNKDNNELIKQYIQSHDNFVNFSLAINEQFNNLNIIINYLYRFIKDKTQRYYKFSLHKMLFNIMKEEFYEKIKLYLEPQFKTLIDQFCQELFSLENKNERRPSFDTGIKCQDDNDSLNESDELEMVDCDSSFELDKKEMSLKEIINFFMKCITDLNINENNANCINHSNIKVDENYLKYENILINSFIDEIDNCLRKEKNSIYDIFNIMKNVLSINDENNKRINLEKYEGLTFIRRTKKIIYKKIKKHLKRKICQNINDDFSKILLDNNMNGNNEKGKNNNNITNISDINKNMRELVVELNNEEKIQLDKKVEKKITKIKNELTSIANSNNNLCNIVNIEQIINNYIENVALENIAILKFILTCFYIDKLSYKESDNKIIDLLK